MPLQQVIHYSATEILELSYILEKRDGVKPSQSAIEEVLAYCCKQIHPQLLITNVKLINSPLTIIFEMTEVCLEQAC